MSLCFCVPSLRRDSRSIVDLTSIPKDEGLHVQSDVSFFPYCFHFAVSACSFLFVIFACLQGILRDRFRDN